MALAAAAALLLLVGACNTNGSYVQPGGPVSSPGGGSTTPSGQNHHYQVDQPITALTLEGHAGSVTVLAGDGPVSVTETPRYTDDQPRTSHEVTATTLALREDGCAHVREGDGQCEVDWEIHAPAVTSLRLHVDAGRISLTGFAADVSASADNGSVTGQDLAGKHATATSNAGLVRLSFTTPPDQVTVTNNAGSIMIIVPAGASYAVHATSDTGLSQIEVSQDGGSTHRIDARTNVGLVQISNG